MKYMGSKRRIAKYIMPIILAGRTEGQLYVEPFVGGANSFEYVANPRLGADVNPYLIACLNAIAHGWIPPSVVTEEEYKTIRDNKDAYPPELVGFVGFGCSFSGKWFSGYARDKVGNRNFARESRDLLIRQSPHLYGATFIHSSYQMLNIPDNSIVYCDPPYANTSSYKVSGAFNHTAFWQWVTDLSQRCRVFVSEYTAPDGWECIWAMGQTTNLDNQKGKAFTAIEKLFVPSHQLARLL